MWILKTLNQHTDESPVKDINEIICPMTKKHKFEIDDSEMVLFDITAPAPSVRSMISRAKILENQKLLLYYNNFNLFGFIFPYKWICTTFFRVECLETSEW